MSKFKDLATESFVWAKQLSDLTGKPEKQLPTLLAVLHFLHRKPRATLPAILKDEIEALLGDPDVPTTFRLVSVNIARIAIPESAALVGAITTDLDGSENAACVAAAAAGLASLPGKQLLEFMAKSTEGGTWSWAPRARARWRATLPTYTPRRPCQADCRATRLSWRRSTCDSRACRLASWAVIVAGGSERVVSHLVQTYSNTSR